MMSGQRALSKTKQARDEWAVSAHSVCAHPGAELSHQGHRPGLVTWTRSQNKDSQTRQEMTHQFSTQYHIFSSHPTIKYRNTVEGNRKNCSY